MLTNDKGTGRRDNAHPDAPRSFRRAGRIALLSLLLLAPAISACGSQSGAQVQATQTASPAATITAATPAASPSAAAQPSGTDTPRPLPTGPTPTDPINVLNVFNFFPSSETLIKRDALNISGDAVPEMLYTIAAPRETITGEATSALAVIEYDPKYHEWNVTWQSEPRPGVASPLPAANRSDGYNGGDLLRTGSPIFVVRTTTGDRHAHMYLYKWDGNKHTAAPVRMQPAGSGPEKDSDFEGDLDVNIVDLDGDGKYEVVADNLTGVQVWKWDGSKFAPESKR